ncbi:MAG: hypothetical protein HY560_10275 [Gemmatimonadetes bacterium]|nr:hypothetical protein [Gemmatimonadota bacterium]
MTALGILSPGYPGTPGGVTDHTARLVESWSAAGHMVWVTGELSRGPETVVAEWLERGVRAVLIEYVPFLYGRRGVSRYPESVASAARARGLRVVVFVHEPWVPPTRPMWLVTGPIQRVQLHRLARRASGVATAVPAWQPLLGPRAELVYVGSSLGEVPSDAHLAPALSSPVVFSPAAAGLNLEWIVAAVRAIGENPALVVIGTDASSARAHRGLARHFDPAWDWRGRLPAADALRLLARAKLVLAPFVDGATGRRTSLLASLSTGARVISSRGHLLDPLFAGGPLLLAATRDEFVNAARRVWSSPDSPEERARRLAWYRQHFDPRTLDRRLLGMVLGSAE